ncbi:unnamed protein product, partial [Laminaria digitata]
MPPWRNILRFYNQNIFGGLLAGCTIVNIVFRLVQPSHNPFWLYNRPQPATRGGVRFTYVGRVYSGYGYGSLTELGEVPGTGVEVLQNPQKLPRRYTNVIPVPV